MPSLIHRFPYIFLRWHHKGRRKPLTFSNNIQYTPNCRQNIKSKLFPCQKCQILSKHIQFQTLWSENSWRGGNRGSQCFQRMKNHTFIEYVQGGKLLHRICLDLNTLSHVLMLNLWNEAPLKSRARCQYFPETNCKNKLCSHHFLGKICPWSPAKRWPTWCWGTI